MNIPVNYVEHERQSDGRNIGVIITVMQPRSVMALDAWADVDAAIDAARQARKQRIERLTTASSLVILSGAVWLCGRTFKPR